MPRRMTIALKQLSECPRSHWDADALAQKDLEIARCEELYRAQALEAASHLVARFAEEKSPESEHTLHAEAI